VERAISADEEPAPAAALGRKLRRARALGASDWPVLLRAAGWLAFVRAGLLVASLRRLERLMERGLPPRSRPPDPARAVRLAALVDIAARNAFPPATCLPRALVLRRLLRRERLPASLRIGVRRGEDGVLEAHAWVESAGEVIGDAPDVGARFAPLRPGAEHLRAPWAPSGATRRRVYSAASDPAEESEP